MKTISFVDVIIDRPRGMLMTDVLANLKRGKIDGHNILAVTISARHREDDINIPHIGHDYRCDSDPGRCSQVIGKAAYRNFCVRLVVDGEIQLHNLPYTEFDVGGALLALGPVQIVPVVDPRDRNELRPSGNQQPYVDGSFQLDEECLDEQV